MSFLELLLFLFTFVSYCCSDSNVSDVNYSMNFSNDITEKIGNFSLELLYHVSKEQNADSNLILSPITVWTLMSLIAEGATDNTLAEINNVLRITNNQTATRTSIQNIGKLLGIHTKTVELQKTNAIFVDELKPPLNDFQLLAKSYYDTQIMQLNFSDDKEYLAQRVNEAISNFTNGKIPKTVDKNTFLKAEMILTSALYFRGQWTVPFNVTATTKRPFYNSNGIMIGEVNMMFNRYPYSFVYVQDLQAKVLEIPYGNENRVSMLIMLPDTNVRLDQMLRNFKDISLARILTRLRIKDMEREEDEADPMFCSLPRFNIDSSLDIKKTLKVMGIKDLFDKSAARLPKLTNTASYIYKVIHKATIEVTEEGTTAAAVTVAESGNRIGIPPFEVNRPFFYVIVEKVTNSILFGGFYRQPSLY